MAADCVASSYSVYSLDDVIYENFQTNVSDTLQVCCIFYEIFFFPYKLNSSFYLNIKFCIICLEKDRACCVWCWGSNFHSLRHNLRTQGAHCCYFPYPSIFSFHSPIMYLLQMIKSETRASLIKFLQLIVAHHPSRRLMPHLPVTWFRILLLCLTLTFCIRCRKGSADILVNFNDLCPADILSAGKYECTGTLSNFQICGKGVPRGYWVGNQYPFLLLQVCWCRIVFSMPRKKKKKFVYLIFCLMIS